MMKLKVGSKVKVPSKDFWGKFDYNEKLSATLIAIYHGNPPYCVRFDERNGFSHGNYPDPDGCFSHTGEKNTGEDVYYYYYENEITSSSREIVLDFEN